MKNVTTRETVPCAYVTKGKQRIKQFDKTVYLNNGDEFEIELFNPTTNKVLAQIELNGKSIGAGIVLRPGERVFLERYIETARKFLFETYTVNGDNSEVQKAIALNGLVSVKFYGESISFYNPPIYYKSYPSIDWNYHNSGTFNYSNCCATLDCCDNNSKSIGATGGASSSKSYTEKKDTIAFFSSSVSNATASAASATFTSSANVNYDEDMEDERDESKIETGRIEKGSASNQTFQFDDTQFNTYWSWSSDWKILPRSQKPVTSEELNTLWCGNCGAKKGKGKFCQFCGANHWVIK